MTSGRNYKQKYTYMDLTNDNKIKSFQEPTHNTQVQPLPKGVMSDAKNGYMGADTGVNGRMGDYSSGVTNNE